MNTGNVSPASHVVKRTHGQYPTRGIPTEYNGINFRSRLEATWARFFDLCKWNWEYEPFDLDGYIPDFALLGHTTILVDVKPVLDVSALRQRAVELEAYAAGMEFELLVLGATLIDSTVMHGKAIGLLGSPVGPDGEHVYDVASLFACRECGERSFFHDSLSWASRMCDHYDGKRFVGDFDDADDVWAQAKNGAQWKAVKPAQWLRNEGMCP